jgi:cyclase
VVSIDCRGDEVCTKSGQVPTGRDPVDVAQAVEELGAGEILLQSIDEDGVMNGYDVATVARVSAAVSIPVIASGGAGTFSHMADVIREGGASAVAAASMFHFTEQTPMEAKHYLASQGFPVRV